MFQYQAYTSYFFISCGISCGVWWKFCRKSISYGLCQGFSFRANTSGDNCFLRILGFTGKIHAANPHEMRKKSTWDLWSVIGEFYCPRTCFLQTNSMYFHKKICRQIHMKVIFTEKNRRKYLLENNNQLENPQRMCFDIFYNKKDIALQCIPNEKQGRCLDSEEFITKTGQGTKEIRRRD